MLRNLDDWFALSPRVRGGYGLLLLAVFSFLFWWWLVQPFMRERIAWEQQRLVQQSALQDSWQEILVLKPPDMLFATSGEPAPFSPLDVHSYHTRLVRWHPAQGGGEIVLEAQWASIPQMFSLLAERQMFTATFSITAEQNALRFVLQLERADGQ